MSSVSEELHTLLIESLRSETFRKAVFSKPSRRASDLASRVDVRPVDVAGQTRFQLTTRVGTQDHHRNVAVDEAVNELPSLIGKSYLDIRLETTKEVVVARHSRKGVCRMSRKPVSSAQSVEKKHNRVRDYLIPDNQPVPFLVATGIMSKAGRVRDQHRKKFRQINRFAEFIRDVMRQLAVPADQLVNIVDFGCGKSYLTFATHYLLTQVLGRRVRITGLDRRPDVIESCHSVCEQLELDGLDFRVGDISEYRPQGQVDISISLHACDTATDDAIAVAADWKARAILAVPCCQHELASRLATERMPVLSRHGIIHERFASLATDSIRAGLLQCIGYRTQLIEFIDMEHTPKNVLIRAVRREDRSIDSPDPQYWNHLVDFQQQLGVSGLRLQRKLEEYGILPTPVPPNA